METESRQAERYIRDKLLAHPGLSALVGTAVYRGKARGSPDGPFIIYSLDDANDELVVGGRRQLTNVWYRVRAVCKIPTQTDDIVDQVAAAIDDALQGTSDPAYSVGEVDREGLVNREYTVDGVDYQERGGVYRLLIGG